MKKTIACAFAAVSLILPTTVWGIENNSTNNNTNNINNIKINQLALQNFIDTRCHTFKPLQAVLTLNERHVTRGAWGAGATSCKGEICWSWDRGEGFFDWQLYSSNLPLRISNTERLSKSIAQTIRSSNSLRKSASDLVNTAQEFLQTSFGGGKERGTAKERTITESKSQEQSVETNITPLFHRFLAMGVQSVWPAYYDLCFGSAADLFFKAYYSNRVNDLVEAFIFFQTMQPEDLKLTNEKSLLNRAKLLYLISKGEIKSKESKSFAWASALLFAKLLEWEEFQQIKSIVDDYIDKVYEKYQLLKTHTTKELLEIDKELAAYKYTVDKILQSENKTQNMQEVEDFYAMIAMERFFPANEEDKKLVKKLQQQLDEALKKNDPLLNAKLIKEELKVAKVVKDKPIVVAGAGAGVGAIGIGVAGALYFRKRRKQNSTEEKQNST
jgi:hypothetical protein